LLSAKRIQVSELAAVGGKDNARERAAPIVRAKVQKGVLGTRSENAQYPPPHTAGRPDARARIAEGDAVSGFALRTRGQRGSRAGEMPEPNAIGYEGAESRSDQKDSHHQG
jgi:hypothetical protein